MAFINMAFVFNLFWLTWFVYVSPASSICDYKLKKPSGYIKSPGYPNAYPHKVNCSWQLVVAPGSKIVVRSEMFEVESSYNCESDALYVYDGAGENAKLYSRPYCDIDGPKYVVSSGNALFLRFITDSLDTGRGFLLRYTSFKVCGAEFKRANGSFTSPGYPTNYNENANCSYRITTDKTKVIVLRFIDFSLENPVNGKCLDYVSIYDVIGDSLKLTKKICGKTIPLPFQSLSNKLVVKFNSDGLINNPGFSAVFHSAYYSCAKSEFKCDNGRCIDRRELCNQVNDCYDNSDEVLCTCAGFKCQNQRCVTHLNVCDGLNQCGDWSDEVRCQVKTTPYIDISRHTLTQTTVMQTTPYFPTCGYEEYRCTNKKCIEAKYRCNGDNDCGDNSEEDGCIGQCQNSNGGCAHTCSYNRIDGVKCGCYHGFHLNTDRKSCIDVNECSAKPCAMVCINELGSYKCECHRGFRLTEDKHNCIDFDECSESGHCEQRCINKNGTFECDCFAGYVFDKIENRCLDTDECAVNNGGCMEKCVNTIGDYRCECNHQGYSMIAHHLACEEMNECELGTAACSQTCVNTDGSYHCECSHGFYLDYDNHNCLDIDECQLGAPGCWGSCMNTLGSYYCECDAGYREISNKTKCADIDECKFQNGGCSNICINTIGSFECRCHNGYIARDPRSFTCVDQDECLNKPCDHLCLNTPGSFQCQCEPGYELFNKTKCVDVNECLDITTTQCEYQCMNTPGSYICTCMDGFVLNNDKLTCVKTVNDTGCRRLKVDTKNIYDTQWSNNTREWGWKVKISLNFGYLQLPRFNCMGILVHEQYVLATSDCLRYGRYIDIEVNRLMLTLGRTGTGVNDIQATQVIFHPNLAIALIRLKNKIKVLKPLQTICLPRGEYDVDVSTHQKLVSVTWPPNSENLPSQHMFAKVVSSSMCSDESSICVNLAADKFTLPMSGSPLVGILRGSSLKRQKQKWILVGVLIRGSAYPNNKKKYAARKDVPYLRASSFAGWIRNVTILT